jgi:hypothetical protein
MNRFVLAYKALAQGKINVPVARFSASASIATSSFPQPTTPSVCDIMIKLTFVDPSGARRQVPGLIGKSLYEICEMHGIDLGPCSLGGQVQAVRSDTWTEPLYGEGPTTGYDHVLLVGNGVETAEPITNVERKLLDQYWDEDEIFPGMSTYYVETTFCDNYLIFEHGPSF